MGDATSPLGTIELAATTLYVSDLDAAVAWYADKLGLDPVMAGSDTERYASYLFGASFVVLEPLTAALEAAPPGAESTTVNVLVDRDPAEVREELLARGVRCGPLVRSQYCSFLMRDLDGNRFYVARPVTEDGRRAQAEATKAAGGA
jgi:catechol 2,3-dioxygenase-like lactoylglutathione lyase family enzyme